MSRDHTELMHAVLDGEASPEEIAELERELGSDPDARARFEALRELHELLEGMPTLDPPPELAGQVLARLAGKEAADAGGATGSLFAFFRSGGPVLRYAAAFAAGLLATAAVYEFGLRAQRDIDISMVAGTMVNDDVRLPDAVNRRTELAIPGISGDIELQHNQDLVLVAFDLVSEGEVEMVLPGNSGGRIVGFTGLDQPGTDVSLVDGWLRVRQPGPHRYIVFLRGAGPVLPVEIHRDGEKIHELELEVPARAE